jgi:hypothetical protein
MTVTDEETMTLIGEYLERCGVVDLRHPHNANAFNKTAILRYLVAEKLQEALDNPPTPAGHISRHGAGGKRSRSGATSTPATKSRQ